MKCMYYLAPTLVSTNQISEDLRDVDVDDVVVADVVVSPNVTEDAELAAAGAEACKPRGTRS